MTLFSRKGMQVSHGIKQGTVEKDVTRNGFFFFFFSVPVPFLHIALICFLLKAQEILP